MLYIVPTPIGNLEDITLRALRILQEVQLILAEDTRTSKQLLKKFEIETPLRSYHIHNEHKVLKSILEDLKSGTIMALVSDAGTPAISDPGYLLVRECIREGIEVNCLPGATALIPALVNSGYSSDRFHYEGFLPHKKGRQTRLKYLAELESTIVLYESPHRLVKSMTQMVEYFGADRQAAVSRELSKIHEENKRGTLKELIDHFSNKKVKGEIVIVLEGIQKGSAKKKPKK